MGQRGDNKEDRHHFKQYAAYLAGSTGVALILAGVYAFAQFKLHHLPYFYFFCGCLLVTSLLTFVVGKNNRGKTALPTISPSPIPREMKWCCLLSAVALLLYIALALLLSTAWLKGDDYASSLLAARGIRTQINTAINGYASHVSRNGDILIKLMPLAENRWQVWILNPLVVLLVPYGLLRLTGNGRMRLYSPKGILFFILFFLLASLSCKITGNWRNYWCYAASANYLWPTVAAIYLISFYRKEFRIDGAISKPSLLLKCTALFLLGIYTGSGPECLSVILVPLSLAWVIGRLWQRKRIAWGCLAASIGTIWGAFFVYASPALFNRKISDAAFRQLHVNNLSYDQIVNFVQNLTWEKVCLLKDCSSVINFEGIPLWLHIYFLPWLAESYGECCCYTLITFALLFLLLLAKKQPQQKRIISIAAIYLVASSLSALAYLSACIPTAMSFLPAVYILLAGCAFLYQRLPYRWIPQSLITAACLTTALILLLPPGIEAWHYKKYERERAQYIRQQKAEGVDDVVVPPLFPKAPQDGIGLIGGMRGGLNNTGGGYPNSDAARHYGIKSLSQQ